MLESASIRGDSIMNLYSAFLHTIYGSAVVKTLIAAQRGPCVNTDVYLGSWQGLSCLTLANRKEICDTLCEWSSLRILPKSKLVARAPPSKRDS
jgi:hypothetical protein